MRLAHDRLLEEIGPGGGLCGGGPVVSRRGQGRGLRGSQGQLCGRRLYRAGGQGLSQAGWRGGDVVQIL